MYLSIRHYKTSPNKSEEAVRTISDNLLPKLAQQPGFDSAYVMDEGGGNVTLVSIFDNQSQAQASNKMEADFVQKNMSSTLPNPPSMSEGPVTRQKGVSGGPSMGMR